MPIRDPEKRKAYEKSMLDGLKVYLSRYINV